MKKCFVFAMAVLAFLSLNSCNEKKTATEEKEITLVMAEVNPPDTVVGRMDQAFKEKVEELSGGKIKIDLQCSGILGDEKQVMNIIMSPDSSIQIVRGPSNLSSYSEKAAKSSLISIPYTFKNDEHFWKFASSDLAEELLNEPYELGVGVKGLFYAQEGLRHYFSTTKIETVDELKGKKMRVAGNVLTGLANAFGAVPVEVKFANLYEAMLMGTVEVAEQPITNYLTNSFHKVAPYMIFDGHMLGAVSVMINATCWDSLSQNQKNILHEAGQYASEYCRKIVNEANEEAIKTLKAEGVTFTEVSDISPWQKASAKIIEESAKVDAALYKQILELAK